MAVSSIEWAFLILLSTLTFCYGAPISDYGILSAETAFVSSNVAIVVSVVVLLLCAILILGCTCCPHKEGQTLANSRQCPIRHPNEGNVSQLQRPSEFAIFPPCSSIISLQPVRSSGFGNEEEKVIFEPLPDILPKRHGNGQNLAQSSKPAHFSALLKNKSSLHDWFDDPSSNFPRNQLQYLREMGNGWFGRVVEGEAQMILADKEKTPVMVKILREEASPSEHLYFLHEVRPYRNLQHVNVLRLLGRCLETDPFLLIMEHTIMDLKSYLIKNHDTFMQQNDSEIELLLQWAADITSGLSHMHEHGFTHTDLAAHNCFVTAGNTIKIGDYGLSFDIFREDYYCLGDIALPIRWYSPETLLCSDTTIETKDITKEANIWSLAVVFWELLEFGKLPYADLNNEEVLQQVIIERSVQLKIPQLQHPHKEQMFQVMQLCWNPPPLRPKIQEIEILLRQIREHKDFSKSFSSFEERWNALQSQTSSIIPDVSLKFENDFVPSSDKRSGSLLSADCNLSESSMFELSEPNPDSYLSASLRGLNGSFDEIGTADESLNVPLGSSGNVSALDNSMSGHSALEDSSRSCELEVVTPEQISEAIRDFDAMLATEALLLGVDSRSTTLERPKEKYKPFSHDDVMTADCVSKLQELSEHQSEHDENSAPIVFKAEPITDIACCNSSISTEKNCAINVKDVNQSTLISSLKDKDNSNVVMSRDSPDHNISKNGAFSFDIPVKHVQPVKNFNNLINTENFSCSDNFIEPELAEAKPPIPFPSHSNLEKSDFVPESQVTTEDALKSGSLPFLVPDIVIDTSTFCETVDHSSSTEEDATNNQTESTESSKPSLRKFRFVLKEDSHAKEISAVEESSSSNLCDDRSLDSRFTLGNHSEETGDLPGPLTSTPTKGIDRNVFFGDDDNDFYAKTEQSLKPCPNLSLISTATSTNTEQYDSAINTGFSDTTVSSVDYETAVSTFDIMSESLLDTVFGNSETFVNDSSSDVGITKSNSFFYDDPNNVTKTELSHRGIVEINKNSLKSDAFVSEPCSMLDHKSQENCWENNLLNHGSASEVQEDIFDKRDTFCESRVDKLTESTALTLSSQPSGISVLPLVTAKDITSVDSSDQQKDRQLDSSPSLSNCQEPSDSKDYSVIQLTSEGEVTGISDTVSDSFAFKKTCDWSAVDDTSAEALTFSDGLTQSISDTISESFVYDKQKENDDSEMKSEVSDSFLFTKPPCVNSFTPESYNSDTSRILGTENDHVMSNPASHEDATYRLRGHQEITIEDLETEQSTSYVVSDEYDDQLDEEEVLRIDTETNEAILVDSSESLIGFVPSRSIEMLQECDDIASHFDGPVSNSHVMEESDSSSPSSMSHSSKHASLDLLSNRCNGSIVEHFGDSPDMSPTAVVSSSEDMLSDQENERKYVATENPELNNNVENDLDSPDIYNDTIYSNQPTKSVVWHSDETLDVLDDNEPNCNVRPVVIESQEIMAGSNFTRENAIDKLKSELSGIQFGSRDFLDRLVVSPTPSPHDSAVSTPCRDVVYTPDFESESEDSSSSCSSTSGSFECIHNKFKDVGNISLVSETAKEESPSITGEGSEEMSPTKIFSTTWDCHATPNKGLLKSPEKKVLPMRKSVSFHEEPQQVFQYPPASDSSEDDFVEGSDDFSWRVDYTNYADWELQVSEEDEIPEEMIEIEELESEPYNRSLYRGSRPLTGSSLYTITGFSAEDEDLDYSELKGSSQFSSASDFEFTSSGTISPVRVFACANGLSLIKEGSEGEEEMSIEELPAESTNNIGSNEPSAVSDVKMHIELPDNNFVTKVERDSEASNRLGNVEDVTNEIGCEGPSVEIEEEVEDQEVRNPVEAKQSASELNNCSEQPLIVADSHIHEDSSPKKENPELNIVSLKENILETVTAKNEECSAVQNSDTENENSCMTRSSDPQQSSEYDTEADVVVDIDKKLSIEESQLESQSNNVGTDSVSSTFSYVLEDDDLLSDYPGATLSKEETLCQDDDDAPNQTFVSSNDGTSTKENGGTHHPSSPVHSSKILSKNEFSVSPNKEITTSDDIIQCQSHPVLKKKPSPNDYTTESHSDILSNQETFSSEEIVRQSSTFSQEETSQNGKQSVSHSAVLFYEETSLNNKDIMQQDLECEGKISHGTETDQYQTSVLPEDASALNGDESFTDVPGIAESSLKSEVNVNTYDKPVTNYVSTVLCENSNVQILKSENPELQVSTDSVVQKGEVGTQQNGIDTTDTTFLTDIKQNQSVEEQNSLDSTRINDTNLKENVHKKEASSAIPSIVVTDAEMPFLNDEFESFLNGHMKFYELEPKIEDVNFHTDDFAVTSGFSETPFEDTYGYCNGKSFEFNKDFDFTEAVNRHCSAQNFADISSLVEASNVNVSSQKNGFVIDQVLIDSNNSRSERSSSLPVMHDEKNGTTEQSTGFSSL